MFLRSLVRNLLLQRVHSMTNAFLASLIPESNRLDLPFARGLFATQSLESLYSVESGFVGAFIDNDDQPTWARRACRYLDDEFLHDTPGRLKYFSDVLPQLADDGAGKCLANFRYALDLWHEAGKPGVEPYTCQQDYGSCVDASCSEQEATLMAVRIALFGKPESWKQTPAWYKDANRGYCSDGWNGSGIATVARQVGVAFRTKYQIGSNSVDFTDDDKNEQIVARTWCRSGIPSWLREHTQANHAYEDGAITRFEGGVKELRALFAAGGVIHTSGTRTSGGSKPFTIGSVGPHMQSGVGCDDSDEFRKFCREIIKVTPRANDFPVVMNQTWGPGWRGECADQYWPAWWGRKPQGAWVWWASDVINRLSCDYAWLPWVKGFPSDTPLPPPVQKAPPISGLLHGELTNGRIVIRGELAMDKWRYIAVPDGTSGQNFKIVEKPSL